MIVIFGGIHRSKLQYMAVKVCSHEFLQESQK